MRIFLSHSISDFSLVRSIEEGLRKIGVDVLIAEHHLDAKRNITEKIEELIKESDIGLILLTQKGFDSHFVQQEIGYLKASEMPFIQVVEKGLENKLSGFNHGRDYIVLDPLNLSSAVDEVVSFFCDYRSKTSIQTMRFIDNSHRVSFSNSSIKKHQSRSSVQSEDIVLIGLVGVVLLGILSYIDS